jgi:hypothetical protein
MPATSGRKDFIAQCIPGGWWWMIMMMSFFRWRYLLSFIAVAIQKKRAAMARVVWWMTGEV